jgi:hypothetical protein
MAEKIQPSSDTWATALVLAYEIVGMSNQAASLPPEQKAALIRKLAEKMATGQ